MEEKITQIWVKKWASANEWKSFYNQNNIYCPIRKENGGIIVGFLLTNKHLPLKQGLSIVNDEEARIMDFYRRANNIRPFVLTEPQEIKEEIPDDFPFGEN